MSKRWVPPAKLCMYPILLKMGPKLMSVCTLLSSYKYERDDYQVFAIELKNREKVGKYNET